MKKSISAARRWLHRNRREAAGLVFIAVALLAVLLLTHHWWDDISAALRETNVYLFLALLCLLPLAGVSVALMYVVAGARFGGPLGLAVVAGATAFHLVATWAISRSILRGPLQRLARRRNYRLPEYAQQQPVAFTLLAALMPGLPYVVRNYLLALTGVPFRFYLGICWPVYVVRSGVAIYLGDWVDDLTPTRVAVLAGILILKVSICAVAVWQLRRRQHARHPRAGSPAAHRA